MFVTFIYSQLRIFHTLLSFTAVIIFNVFVCLFILCLTSRLTIVESFWGGFLGLCQHCAPGEDRTRDLANKSPTLSKMSYRCSHI